MHIVIGLILAFLLLALFAGRKTRRCRWRMDRSRNEAGKTCFQRMAFGAVVFADAETAPETCLKEDLD